MIKYKIYLNDLFDVIDPILANYPHIDKIFAEIDWRVKRNEHKSG